MTRNKAESQKRAKLLNKANELAAMRMSDLVYVGPDPERLREIEELVASIQPRDAESLQSEKPKGTSNDVRDKFIYGHAMKGVPWLRIRILLAKSKRWCDDPLAYKDGVRDVSGVRKAAFRYAKTHGLPEPPKRQAGRPST